ncbi:MAG: FAD-dependent oxidoreductase, partial [Planctomycetaceae bacterium]
RFLQLCRRIQDHDALNLSRQYLSARQVVGEFLTNEVLIDMLFCPLMFYGSATPHDMDFSQFVIMFKSILHEGFGRPFAGVRPIFKHLVRQFKSYGGELKLRSGVRSIHCDGQRACGVTLDDGSDLEARNILSTAGAAETLRMCDDPDQVQDLVDDHPPGEISFVESISILDCQPAELDHEQTIVFYNAADRFHYQCPSTPIDGRSGIICSPNNFQYEKPLDEGRIRITSLAAPDCWMNLPETEYVAQKQECARQMAESAVRFMPDFRDHVVDLDIFTPRTIRKFTGHINGCVYGAPDKLVDGRTSIDNLYLCGTDQGFLGIIGAMLSGITIANRHLLQ